jgi:nucleoside-diphosphate-sugar epimerase
MKVCITGASGFLGSWTARVLSDDFDVFAFARTGSSMERLASSLKINVITESVENWPSLINKITPDVLIMHDWQGVGNSDRNSQVQYSNLERIKALVTALNPIQQVIGVGSQAELGPKVNEIQEDDISRPTSDYGRAKVQAREFLSSHFQDRQTNFKWARIFSTYGATDNGDWLIPNLVRSLNEEQPVALTLGIQEWNYLHAYDAACAFKKLATEGDPGVYNIADLETHLIRDVCTEIASLMGKDPKLLKFGEVPMRLDQVYKLDVSTKKLQGIGWNPAVDFTQGLIHTINSILEATPEQLQLKDGSFVTM